MAGSAMVTPPSIRLVDTYGNTVTSPAESVTLSAFTDSGCTSAASGTLAATTNPVTSVVGFANFANVSYTKAETIYLKAAATGLTSACSNAVVVSPAPAASLAYSTAPSTSASAGVNFAAQPVVEILDSYSNRVTASPLAITLAAYTDAACTSLAGGTLAATTNPLTSSSGLSAFAAVSYSTSGTIYLGATAAGVTKACSAAITVTGGSATKLGFFTQPSATGTAGALLAIQPAVEAQDAGGTRVTSATDAITLSAFTDAACTVAALGTFSVTTNPVSATSGLSTFAGISYTKAETIYIKATATGLTETCSSAIVVSPAAAAGLAFSTQPSGGTAGVALATQPAVRVPDAYGNNLSSGTQSITLGAYSDASCTTAGAGTFSATTNPLSATAALATFAGVTYTKSGNLYIKASAAGLTDACSSASAIVAGAATKILGVTAPSTPNRPNVNMATAPTFEITDAYNNRSLSASNSITLAAFTDSGCTSAAGGTISATTNPLAATSGLAAFTSVKYSRGEIIYLGAATAGLTSACTAAVTYGVDLEVSIELADAGISSNTSATLFERTRTSVTPSLYDGSPVYTFEIVSTNVGASAADVNLVNNAGTTVATISVTAATSVPTRFATTFTPGATPVNFRLETAATTVAQDLSVYAARVRIVQTYATKTQLYFPLTANPYNTVDNLTTTAGGLIDSTGAAGASQPTPAKYVLWRKDAAKVSGLAATTPWTFEAVIAKSGTNSAAAGLYTAAGTLVTGVEITSTATVPTLLSLPFADNATNFADATNFMVQIRRAGGGTTAYLYKAALYATLTNIVSTQTYFRVSRSASAIAATTINPYQRALIDTSRFSSPTATYEITGSEPTVGTSSADLYNVTTTDSGTAGTSVASSPLDPGSTTRGRFTSGALTLTNGDRYLSRTSITTGTLTTNSAFIIIQAQ
jgi:hypothetical protein